MRIIGFLIGVFILVALLAVPAAFILMLLLGALHHLTGWPTAIGFWACWIIVVIIGMFMPKGSSS